MEGEQVDESQNNMGGDESTRAEWRDMFMEISGEDEEIDKTDLQNLLFLVGQNPTQDELDALFQQMDKNSDDKVNFDEFCEIMNRAPDPEDDMRAALKEYDKNGDGYLDREEIIALLCADGSIDKEDEDILELVDAADEDKDGKLTIDTFVKLILNPQAQRNLVE